MKLIVKIPGILHLLSLLYDSSQKTVDLIETFVHYMVVGARNADAVKVRATIIEEADKKMRDVMGTVAELWIQEGLQKGREEERRASAKRLLERNVAMDIIVDATGLSEEEIKKLR